MRYLHTILGFLLFLAVLGFALKNTQPVELHYYLGLQWNAPLILALLIAFCAGTLAGILACLSLAVRYRRRLLAAEKELKKLRPEAE